MKMAALQSGVLVKLLTSMNLKEKPLEKQKPTLLQIRSIVPVMDEGDLWPNKGFFLKVSDDSHAIYASLPQEQDDMILSNKLQLGQLLYVDNLEPGYPVPFLKGVKPVAGRHRCVGNPEDLVSLDFLLKFRGVVGTDSVVKKVQYDVMDDRKRNSLCPANNRSNDSKDRSFSNHLPPRNVGKSDVKGNSQNFLSKFVDKDTDADGASSMSSLASSAKRKSWNKSEFKRNGDISNSPVSKSKLEFRRIGDDSDSSVLKSTIRGDDLDPSILEPARKPPDSGCSSDTPSWSSRVPFPDGNVSSRSKKANAASEFSDFRRGIQNIESRLVDKGTDRRNSLSAVSLVSAMKRRNCIKTEFQGDGEAFDPSVLKSTRKPPSRHRCSGVPPNLSSRFEIPDENMGTRSRRYSMTPTPRLYRRSGKNMTTIVTKTNEKFSDAGATSNLTDNSSGVEDKILWDSLSSNLEKLAKEVIRQRNKAMLAAIDALQEASAAERVLKCLSSYSELQSAKKNEGQTTVDKFFNLQEDLGCTRVIVKSLKSINPLEEADSDPYSPKLIMEAIRTAMDRQKNAKSWINAALASDLTLRTPRPKPSTVPNDASDPAKRAGLKQHEAEGKGSDSYILTRLEINDYFKRGSKAEHGSQDWAKGVSVNLASELDDVLQNECRRWFLSYIEQYLDWINANGTSRRSDNAIAGMMYQLKRVNDWLDETLKETRKIDSTHEYAPEGDEITKAYGRVRNKIYGVLMKFIERTAMALES